jgi:hypothetical protein
MPTWSEFNIDSDWRRKDNLSLILGRSVGATLAC